MSLEDSGFGAGWSLNLRNYRHRQSRAHSLVIGEHQQIIKTTSRLTVKDQKLESFPFQKSGGDYQVMHVSGDIEILCNESDTATAPVKSAINVKDDAEGLLKIDCSDVELDAIKYPGEEQPKITTVYRFYEFNLLGYGGVNDQDPDRDNLFDARTGHHYNSTLEVEGGAELNYICNKFHLGSSPRQQGKKSVAQTTERHALEEESFDG
ncbi:uncharacterized protein Y057_4036 [Fusarium fujikuroi]|nr:uncharacterized protein Y057_4036 [Fusarium fujikuroi]